MIKYIYSIKNINPDDLRGFFEGWDNKPSREKHYKILSNSQYVILALDGEKVIGFINAVSDKVLSAYIPLLEVLPGYRGRGVGKELVSRMLKALNDYYMIDLCCDANLAGFYSKLGMSRITGMIIRNYNKI